MEPMLLGWLILALIFILLFARVPIAFSLGFSATLGLYLFFAFPEGGGSHLAGALRPMLALIGVEPFAFITSYPLSAVPLFILTGHLAYQSGFTADIFRAARVWLNRLPGGLPMASVIGCGGFSAITGSSVACAAAMGKIAIPEMRRHGYSKALSAGSVAMGGTLGSLIPPSILFILYGVFTEASVSRLFLAGIIPGLISLAGFLLVISLWVRLRPQDAGALPESVTTGEKLRAMGDSWPMLALFVVVIGGIYMGIFTPTESAAVGACLTGGAGILLKRLPLAGLLESLRETVLQTATLFVIAFCAKIFISFVALTGIPSTLLQWTASANLSTAAVLTVVILLYLLLGMVLDSIGIMLLTLPIVTPVVESMGIDMIWFGVIVVKLLEIGLVTPPIGLNVFVIKSSVGEEIRLETIFAGILGFLVVDFLVLLLLIFFPALSLWIPGLAG